MLNNFLYL